MARTLELDTIKHPGASTDNIQVGNASVTFPSGITVDINGGAIDGVAIGASSESSGKFTSLDASGNTTITGNATVNGNTTLGNASSDTITATGRIASDLTPSTDNARDLGTADNSWKDLHVQGPATLGTATITNLNVGGGSGLSGIPITGSTGSFTTLAVTSADTVTMQTYTMGSNGKQNRSVSSSAKASSDAGTNGDIHYQV